MLGTGSVLRVYFFTVESGFMDVIIAILAVLPGLSLLEERQVPPAKEYSSPEGRFLVRFPAEALSRRELGTIVPTRKGQIVIHGIKATLADKAILQVTASRDPEDLVNGKTDLQRLDGVKERLAAALGSKAENVHELTQAKVPGQSFDIPLGGGGLARVRLFVRGPWIYQVMVLGPRATAVGREAGQFLDSFRLAE
jgi:hypothetical protein